MLVVNVDVLELFVVIPIVLDVDVVDVASSCHFSLCARCGKYVVVCRCAFDQMVSWLHSDVRLCELELRGPDTDVWSKRCNEMMPGLLILAKLFCPVGPLMVMS